MLKTEDYAKEKQEIKEMEDALRRILFDKGIDLGISIKKISQQKTYDAQKIQHKAQIVAGKFYYKFITNIVSAEQKNFIPAYKHKIEHGGIPSLKNLILMPKELAIVIDEIFEQFTTNTYAPAINCNKKIITQITSSELEKKKTIIGNFLNNITNNQESETRLARWLTPKELSLIYSGKLPTSLELIKIDYDKDFVEDNLVLVKKENAGTIIKTIEHKDTSFAEKLRKQLVFLRPPYFAKYPSSLFLLKFAATFSPEKLTEIGISNKQADEISFKLRKISTETGFFKRYRSSNKTISLNKTIKSNQIIIPDEIAEQLVNRMYEDDRYIKDVVVIKRNESKKHQSFEEIFSRKRAQYAKMLPYFLRMCANIPEERKKLIAMGLSQVEIDLLKYGIRLSNLSNDLTNDISSEYLSVHHKVPISFGNHIIEKTYNNPEGSITYVPHHRKRNLILLHHSIHKKVHEIETQQRGNTKRIINFDSFGYVFNPLPLLKEYGIGYTPKYKTIPHDKELLSWTISNILQNSR